MPYSAPGKDVVGRVDTGLQDHSSGSRWILWAGRKEIKPGCKNPPILLGGYEIEQK